ncbi:hypothetical protein [Nocardioides hwasunensis]|uniref:DUF732 domain-containing protein n=1 Tax=Nocardioides hwasunensis TaxID=397258 RepID=A0ABR8MJY9_9ACTN|nr:hypothetical protein [Nocardioides hwasunensis]MBD3915895.1 hypothetical protein [Nocardioides hwasunensis]
MRAPRRGESLISSAEGDIIRSGAPTSGVLVPVASSGNIAAPHAQALIQPPRQPPNQPPSQPSHGLDLVTILTLIIAAIAAIGGLGAGVSAVAEWLEPEPVAVVACSAYVDDIRDLVEDGAPPELFTSWHEAELEGRCGDADDIATTWYEVIYQDDPSGSGSGS